jgi:lipoyl-dependent peroxiredoxin
MGILSDLLFKSLKIKKMENNIEVSIVNTKNSTAQGNITSIEKVLYTGKVHTTGGRTGASKSSDGNLDIILTSPGKGDGTNPEQLFAAGWSACYIGALGIAAGLAHVKLPAELSVDAEVDLGSAQGGYFLQARLNVSLPGIDREVAKELVLAAHATCPYSKLTKGNINVEINLI